MARDRTFSGAPKIIATAWILSFYCLFYYALTLSLSVSHIDLHNKNTLSNPHTLFRVQTQNQTDWYGLASNYATHFRPISLLFLFFHLSLSLSLSHLFHDLSLLWYTLSRYTLITMYTRTHLHRYFYISITHLLICQGHITNLHPLTPSYLSLANAHLTLTV